MNRNALIKLDVKTENSIMLQQILAITVNQTVHNVPILHLVINVLTISLNKTTLVLTSVFPTPPYGYPLTTNVKSKRHVHLDKHTTKKKTLVLTVEITVNHALTPLTVIAVTTTSLL
jgi:hypothetical protein